MDVRVWALIVEGIVVNTVLAKDSDPKDPAFLWIDITDVNPQPSRDWTYDGENFFPPS